MGAIAGGRRTQSAFPAFLAGTNASDLGVEYTYNSASNSYLSGATNRTAHLPHVKRAATFVGLNANILKPDGTVLSNQFGLLGSVDGSLFNQDRFTVTKGRMANPHRANEIMVNQFAAKALHVHVGQVLAFGITTASNALHVQVNLKVVGIGLQNFEVVEDDADRGGSLVATPALTRPLLDCCTNLTWTLLQLDHASRDVPAVEREFISILPKDLTYQFHDVASVVAQGERAVRPEAVALGAFGAIAAAAALLIAGQAIVRQLRADREDRGVMRALGATPAMTTSDGLMGAVGAVVVGSLLAAALAVGLSPLAPIGPVRQVDPSTGIATDWTVLGVGLIVLIGALGVVAVAIAVRESPQRVARRQQQLGERESSVARVAAASGLPPPAVTGIRFALEAGRGRTAVPVRSAIAGTVLAVVMVVATVTFGSGLGSLISHPALYGWNWDYALVSADGYGPIPPQGRALLDHDKNVAAWTGVYFGTLQLNGQSVPGIAGDVRPALTPPILSGHAPEAGDQIVLGAATLAQLHKRVGDTVVGNFGNVKDPALSTPPTRLRVVGTATMPALGAQNTLHTSMGTGALFTTQLLPAAALNAYGAFSGPNTVFVRFRSGSDHAAALRSLRRVADSLNQALDANPDFAGAGILVAVVPVQHPAEIVNYRTMGSTPAILASGLAAGAIVALGLTLAASVRRRRRDLALLKTLGFTPRQLATTVAWQASVAAVIGLAVGVPLGIALGRWLWILFARQIYAVPRPAVPALSVILVAVGALLLANAVAALPGRSAARTRAALVLRTE
jgi:hypothetical protein